MTLIFSSFRLKYQFSCLMSTMSPNILGIWWIRLIFPTTNMHKNIQIFRNNSSHLYKQTNPEKSPEQIEIFISLFQIIEWYSLKFYGLCYIIHIVACFLPVFPPNLTIEIISQIVNTLEGISCYYYPHRTRTVKELLLNNYLQRALQSCRTEIHTKAQIKGQRRVSSYH